MHPSFHLRFSYGGQVGNYAAPLIRQAHHMQDIDKFRNLINSSGRILITSHIAPDPDSISSVLLLGTTLKQNYPNKEIRMTLEEEPEGLDFLSGYKDITFGPLLQAVQEFSPDLFIMLDAVNYERCSRNDGQEIRRRLTNNGVKTVIIDHHEPEGKDQTDIYINQGSIATTQDVYEVCFDALDLKKPNGFAETAMLGIYSDSGGFLYKNPRHRQTFQIVSDLMDNGVNLESLKRKLSNYTEDHLRVLAEFAKNVTHDQDYTYTFLTDQFSDDWQDKAKEPNILNTAKGLFSEMYLRNIEDRQWGFIICPDFKQGNDTYSVSLRSADEGVDVSKIANKLSGGGHKQAAGAKIQASSVEEAIQKVKAAISTP